MGDYRSSTEQNSGNVPRKDKIFVSDGNYTGVNLVGGTAFVVGSHHLSVTAVTARLTVEQGISGAGVEKGIENAYENYET